VCAVLGGSRGGGVGARATVPGEWVTAVGEASRMDITATGPTMASVAKDVWAKDQERFAHRAKLFSAVEEAA
jgi:hypothetical protein